MERKKDEKVGGGICTYLPTLLLLSLLDEG